MLVKFWIPQLTRLETSKWYWLILFSSWTQISASEIESSKSALLSYNQLLMSNQGVASSFNNCYKSNIPTKWDIWTIENWCLIAAGGLTMTLNACLTKIILDDVTICSTNKLQTLSLFYICNVHFLSLADCTKNVSGQHGGLNLE